MYVFSTLRGLWRAWEREACSPHLRDTTTAQGRTCTNVMPLSSFVARWAAQYAAIPCRYAVVRYVARGSCNRQRYRSIPVGKADGGSSATSAKSAHLTKEQWQPWCDRSWIIYHLEHADQDREWRVWHDQDESACKPSRLTFVRASQSGGCSV